ncbi:unnamed protein product [Zymoseptoria tritici ST99CH_1A5]|uniref:BTB domain-containing protein n=1 Tax=Zymoseptoria tritici ST99CH_1A5 TaxID=1276529 RepID=A0A1Y6LUK8_ZYMTR|nr:unnamed protein product [Zymoseptoria tritici ST99CH_1A5]
MSTTQERNLDALDAALTANVRPVPLQDPSNGAEDEADAHIRLSYFDAYLYFHRFFVGPDRVEFIIHIGLLEKHCLDLASRLARLKYPSKGSTDVTFGLEVTNVLASTFRLLVAWLYSRQILPVPHKDRAAPGEALDRSKQTRAVEGDARENDVADLDLLRLHHFAQTYGCHGLASDSISLLLAQNARWKSTSTREALDYVNRNFDEDSPVYTLLAHDVADHVVSSSFPAQVLEYPKPFPLRIMQALTGQKEAAENAAQPAETKEERYRRHIREYMHPEAEDGEGSYDDCKCWEKSFSIGVKHEQGPEIYNNTATVLIGREELSFVVHRDVIGKQSAYFRGAFANGFLETHTGIVKLPDESVGEFAMFLGWLYTGTLLLPWADQVGLLDEYHKAVKARLGRDKEESEGQGSDQGSNSSLTAADLANTVLGMASFPALGDGRKRASEDQDSDEHQNKKQKLGRAAGQTSTPPSHDCNKASDSDSVSSHGYDPLPPYEHRLLLASLYNFSCRRLVPALGNQVINILVSTRYSEDLTSLYSADPAMVKLAFALPEKSLLQKFLAEEAVWCWSADDDLIKDNDRDRLDDFPQAFHQAMTRATLTRTANAQANPMYRAILCDAYHEHENKDGKGEERTACKADLKPWLIEQGVLQG